MWVSGNCVWQRQKIGLLDCHQDLANILTRDGVNKATVVLAGIARLERDHSLTRDAQSIGRTGAVTESALENNAVDPLRSPAKQSIGWGRA